MTYDGIVSPMVLMSSSLSFTNFSKCAFRPKAMKSNDEGRKAGSSTFAQKAVLVLVRAASSAASSAEEKRRRSGGEREKNERRS